MVPAGRFRRSRPGAKVTSRRPREPLSLHRPVVPADVLYVSENDALCNGYGDNVKDLVPNYGLDSTRA
jgi:hypothetical protein